MSVAKRTKARNDIMQVLIKRYFFLALQLHIEAEENKEAFLIFLLVIHCHGIGESRQEYVWSYARSWHFVLNSAQTFISVWQIIVHNEVLENHFSCKFTRTQSIYLLAKRTQNRVKHLPCGQHCNFCRYLRELIQACKQARFENLMSKIFEFLSGELIVLSCKPDDCMNKNTTNKFYFDWHKSVLCYLFARLEIGM